MVSNQFVFLTRKVSPACLFALTILCFLPGTVRAQETSSCKGPASLEQALASHPTAGAYNALGAFFATKHRFSCAIPAFESAVRLDQKSSESHYNLGIALLASGNPQRAVQELQTASGLKPNSIQILLALGSALSDLNRNDEAIEKYRAADALGDGDGAKRVCEILRKNEGKVPEGCGGK